MKKKLKSSWKIVSIALILALAVSILCMSGSALPGFSQQSHQSWGDLPYELPVGTVNYYKVSCRNAIDNTTADVYLKAVKNDIGNLNVYESDNYEALYDSTVISTHFDVSISDHFIESVKREGWLVSLKDTPDNPYSEIISVSPLTTTVKSTQTWDGKINDGGVSNYINVSRETTVKYALKGGSSTIREFYVRKVGDSSSAMLRLSHDGQNWSANNITFDDGKTISALLVAAEGDIQPESWVFTVTGYDRLDEFGKLIDYRIEKVDINSSQAWKGGSTQLKHTFGGAVNQNATFVYSLTLKSGTDEYTVLQIEKEMTNGAVTGLRVRGCSEYDSEPTAYTTITHAQSEYMVQPCDFQGNIISFDNYSSIKVSDIINSENGVIVNFNIGSNNGSASVNLKLTESGKLSYDFNGLPADEFTPDLASGQDGTPIAVSSYEVVATVI